MTEPGDIQPVLRLIDRTHQIATDITAVLTEIETAVRNGDDPARILDMLHRARHDIRNALAGLPAVLIDAEDAR